MTQKIMPLSFSRLSTFEQCPAKFDYLYVSKRTKDEGSTATEYGDRVHKALEGYGRAAVTGDEGMLARQSAGSEEHKHTLKQWAPLVDRIVSKPGRKLFEHQMAVNTDLQPVDWFAKDVWLRSIADVLVVDNDTGYVLDYKSGRVKENPTQLQLFAAMVMWQFPEVQTVKTSFIWLAHDQTTDAKYERRHLDALWRALRPRLDYVQETIDLGVFKTKPSPLCGWCPAKQICPDAKRK